jgi:hypothetical protein
VGWCAKQSVLVERVVQHKEITKKKVWVVQNKVCGGVKTRNCVVMCAKQRSKAKVVVEWIN